MRNRAITSLMPGFPYSQPPIFPALQIPKKKRAAVKVNLCYPLNVYTPDFSFSPALYFWISFFLRVSLPCPILRVSNGPRPIGRSYHRTSAIFRQQRCRKILGKSLNVSSGQEQRRLLGARGVWVWIGVDVVANVRKQRLEIRLACS